METSDSEYFESADEDFEFEDELNKNKTLIKHNLGCKSNLSKILNGPHTLSDVNENKEENTERLNQDNVINFKDEKNEATTENRMKNAPILLETNDKPTVNNDDSQPGGCHKVSEMKGEAEDNLWNEGDGWDVGDDSDKDSINDQKEINCTETLTDSVKNTIQNNDMTSIEEPLKATAKENNMWDNEEWENWESVDDDRVPKIDTNLNTDNTSSGSNEIWKGWSNWGVTSILSTASQSVSTLTNSVSQGLSTVLETSIGAPDPAKLAMLHQAEKHLSTSAEPCKSSPVSENKNSLGFGLSNIGNLVSGVSKLVESTSTKVISGGLDTLETIGKKTMEVIQEGDPGLKRKRAFLNLEGEKPVLSHVLREAKEKAEQENKTLREKHFARKVNYETIFDDHQGLVHLEALEMLSKQCDMKLQMLIESNSGNALTEIRETLDQIKELCELPDEEEDEQTSFDEMKEKLKSAIEETGINITYDKLINMWEETECWLNDLNLKICDENEIHQQAVETLAQLTAIAVEQFHKAGELLLIKDHHSTADEADGLVQLTATLTSLIGIVAAKFSDKMNTKITENPNKENINSLITNIFFEAGNSSSYIQDAFQLLVPVLQMGAV